VFTTQRITSWALERQVEIDHFSVTQPTLEDIYLELTGSSPEGHVPGRPEDETNLEVAA
jgi:hypothetical protein